MRSWSIVVFDEFFLRLSFPSLSMQSTHFHVVAVFQVPDFVGGQTQQTAGRIQCGRRCDGRTDGLTRGRIR